MNQKNIHAQFHHAIKKAMKSKKGFLATTALGGITVGVILVGLLTLGVNTVYPGAIQKELSTVGTKLTSYMSASTDGTDEGTDAARSVLLASGGSSNGSSNGSNGSSAEDAAGPEPEEEEEVKLLADVVQLGQCEGGAGVKAPAGLDLKIRKYYYASRTADLSDYTRYEDTDMTECAPYNCYGITGINYTGSYHSGGYAITVVYDASGTYQGEVSFHSNISKYNFCE